ncbi:magnesium transporter [Spiroplasma endosymbiont of Amphibalanus improvisus]|uniref:magnesium transporter n=1 Tax=Spiroplasma endosymbiont of Amphibalanus improvisus TaxID=3066327 RepID=UPI00313E2E77
MAEINNDLSCEIKQLFIEHKIIDLRKLISSHQPADVSEALSHLEKEEILKVIRWLDTATAADVFSYLDNDIKEYIINVFSSDEIEKILEDVYADDIVDVIEEMPANIVAKILKSVNSDTREKINKILRYIENTAGYIMSVNNLELLISDTPRDALKKIRDNKELIEETDYFYVIDKYHHLAGMISLRTLIFSKQDENLESIMERNFKSVKTNTDQEEVLQIFKKYDINVLPVVSEQNRLMGIITVDDIIDVLEEETTEDIHKLAGITPTEKNYFETSVFRMVKSRSGWLMFLMISATLSQIVITCFTNLYNVDTSSDNSNIINYIVNGLLIPMLPIISGTSGNAGSQSSTTVIRALSLRQVKTKEYGRVLYKELRVSLIVGLILITVNFLRMVIIYLSIGDHLIDNYEWYAIATLSIALYLTVVIAKLVGSALPIFAKAIKLDPAIMAAPLLTTIVDALSTAIFFSVGLIFFYQYIS